MRIACFAGDTVRNASITTLHPLRAWQRRCAIGLAVAFAFTSLPIVPNSVWAAAPVLPSINLKTFEINESLGQIVETWQPSDRSPSGLIVHIQDLHTHPQAQHHIAKLIDELHMRFGVKFVALEGAEGLCDTKLYSDLPDPPSTERVARLFMQEGLFTGAEYYAITHPERVTLWGVEDQRTYLEHLKTYQEGTQSTVQANATLQALRDALLGLRKKLYPNELRHLTQLHEAYSQGDDNAFQPYFHELLRLAKKGSDPSRTPVLRTGSDPWNASGVKYPHLRRLARADALYAFVHRLKSSRRYAQRAKRWQRRYDDLTKTFRTDALSQELEALHEVVEALLFTTDTQRTVAHLLKQLTILDELVNNKLSPDHYAYYQQHRDEFTAERFNTLLRSGLGALGSGQLPQALNPEPRANEDFETDLELLFANLSVHNRFYSLAHQRDSALVRNTIELLKNPELAQGSRLQAQGKSTGLQPSASSLQPKLAILITGGFHTPGITQQLRTHNLAYLVITPTVSEEFNDLAYHARLQGELPSYEELAPKLARQTLVPPLATNSHSPYHQALHDLFVRLVRAMPPKSTTLAPEEGSLRKKTGSEGETGAAQKPVEKIIIGNTWNLELERLLKRLFTERFKRPEDLNRAIVQVKRIHPRNLRELHAALQIRKLPFEQFEEIYAQRIDFTKETVGIVDTEATEARGRFISDSRSFTTRTGVLLPVRVEFADHAFTHGLKEETVKRILAVASRQNLADTIETGRSLVVPLSKDAWLTVQGKSFKAIRLKAVTYRGQPPRTTAFTDDDKELIQQPVFRLAINQTGTISIQQSRLHPAGGAYLAESVNEYLTMTQAFQHDILTAYPLGVGEFLGMTFEGQPVGFIIMAHEDVQAARSDGRIHEHFDRQLPLPGDQSSDRFLALLGIIQEFNRQIEAAGRTLRKLHHHGIIHTHPHPGQFGLPRGNEAPIYDFTNAALIQNMSRDEFIFRVFNDFRSFYVGTFATISGGLSIPEYRQAIENMRRAGLQRSPLEAFVDGYFSVQEIAFIGRAHLHRAAREEAFFGLLNKTWTRDQLTGRNSREVMAELGRDSELVGILTGLAGAMYDRLMEPVQNSVSETQIASDQVSQEPASQQWQTGDQVRDVLTGATRIIDQVDTEKQQVHLEGDGPRTFESFGRLQTRYERIKSQDGSVTQSQADPKSGIVFNFPGGALDEEGAIRKKSVAVPDLSKDPGRCVTGDSLLSVLVEGAEGTPSRMAVMPIRDVRGGEQVLSWNERTQRLEPHRIVGLLEMGIKPVIRLTTASGRSIRTTATHPYLTPDGWKPVSQLAVGDRIAVPAGAEAVYVEEGVSLGSNKRVGASPLIHTVTTGWLVSFVRLASARLNAVSSGSSATSNIISAPSGILPSSSGWLSKYRLNSKEISRFLFASSLSLFMFEFLQIALAVEVPVIFQISLSVIQSLTVLRHGQRSFLNRPIRMEPIPMGKSMRRIITHNGHPDPRLRMPNFQLHYESHNRFSYPLVLMSPATVRRNVVDERSRLQIHRSSLRGAIGSVKTRLRDFLSSEAEAAESASALLWDPIVALEPAGAEAVYDIEVEGTHNFLANGIIAHNTYLRNPVPGSKGPGSEEKGAATTTTNLVHVTRLSEPKARQISRQLSHVLQLPSLRVDKLEVADQRFRVEQDATKTYARIGWLFFVNEKAWQTHREAILSAMNGFRHNLIILPFEDGYDAQRNTFLSPFIVPMIGRLMTLNLAGKTLLDLGTGRGTLALVALRCGAKRIVGIDIRAEAIAKLQDILQMHGYRTGEPTRADLTYDMVGIEGDVTLQPDVFFARHPQIAPEHFSSINLILSTFGPFYEDEQPSVIAAWQQVPGVETWLEGGHVEPEYPVRKTMTLFEKLQPEWTVSDVWRFQTLVGHDTRTISVVEATRTPRDTPSSLPPTAGAAEKVIKGFGGIAVSYLVGRPLIGWGAAKADDGLWLGSLLESFSLESLLVVGFLAAFLLMAKSLASTSWIQRGLMYGLLPLALLTHWSGLDDLIAPNFRHGLAATLRSAFFSQASHPIVEQFARGNRATRSALLWQLDQEPDAAKAINILLELLETQDEGALLGEAAELLESRIRPNHVNALVRQRASEVLERGIREYVDPEDRVLARIAAYRLRNRGQAPPDALLAGIVRSEFTSESPSDLEEEWLDDLVTHFMNRVRAGSTGPGSSEDLHDILDTKLWGWPMVGASLAAVASLALGLSPTIGAFLAILSAFAVHVWQQGWVGKLSKQSVAVQDLSEELFSRHGFSPAPDGELKALVNQNLQIYSADDLAAFIKAVQRFDKQPLLDSNSGKKVWWWYLRNTLQLLPRYHEAAHQARLPYGEAVKLLLHLVDAHPYDFGPIEEDITELTNVLISVSRHVDFGSYLPNFYALISQAGKDGMLALPFRAFCLAIQIGLTVEQAIATVKKLLDDDSALSGYVFPKLIETLKLFRVTVVNRDNLFQVLRIVSGGEGRAYSNNQYEPFNQWMYVGVTRFGLTADEILQKIVDYANHQRTAGVPEGGVLEAVSEDIAARRIQARYFPTVVGDLIHSRLPYQIQKSFNAGLHDLRSLMLNEYDEGAWVYDPEQSVWYCLGGRTIPMAGGMRHEFILDDISKLSNSPIFAHLHPEGNESVITPRWETLAYPQLQKKVTKFLTAMPSVGDFRIMAELLRDSSKSVPLSAYIVTSIGITEIKIPTHASVVEAFSEGFGDRKDRALLEFDAGFYLQQYGLEEDDFDFVQRLLTKLRASLPENFDIILHRGITTSPNGNTGASGPGSKGPGSRTPREFAVGFVATLLGYGISPTLGTLLALTVLGLGLGAIIWSSSVAGTRGTSRKRLGVAGLLSVLAHAVAIGAIGTWRIASPFSHPPRPPIPVHLLEPEEEQPEPQPPREALKEVIESAPALEEQLEREPAPEPKPAAAVPEQREGTDVPQQEVLSLGDQDAGESESTQRQDGDQEAASEEEASSEVQRGPMELRKHIRRLILEDLLEQTVPDEDSETEATDEDQEASSDIPAAADHSPEEIAPGDDVEFGLDPDAQIYRVRRIPGGFSVSDRGQPAPGSHGPAAAPEPPQVQPTPGREPSSNKETPIDVYSEGELTASIPSEGWFVVGTQNDPSHDAWPIEAGTTGSFHGLKVYHNGFQVGLIPGNGLMRFVPPNYDSSERYEWDLQFLLFSFFNAQGEFWDIPKILQGHFVRDDQDRLRFEGIIADEAGVFEAPFTILIDPTTDDRLTVKFLYAPQARENIQISAAHQERQEGFRFFGIMPVLNNGGSYHITVQGATESSTDLHVPGQPDQWLFATAPQIGEGDVVTIEPTGPEALGNISAASLRLGPEMRESSAITFQGWGSPETNAERLWLNDGRVGFVRAEQPVGSYSVILELRGRQAPTRSTPQRQRYDTVRHLPVRGAMLRMLAFLTLLGSALITGIPNVSLAGTEEFMRSAVSGPADQLAGWWAPGGMGGAFLLGLGWYAMRGVTKVLNRSGSIDHRAGRMETWRRVLWQMSHGLEPSLMSLLWISMIAGILIAGSMQVAQFVDKQLYGSATYTVLIIAALVASSLTTTETAGLLAHLIFKLFRRAVAAGSQAPTLVPDEQLPTVTVQLPARNEPIDVLAATLSAAMVLDYPPGKLQIQIIDNSDLKDRDGRPIRENAYTVLSGWLDRSEEAKAFRQRHGADAIQLVHREGTNGAKARNLNIGLQAIDSQYILQLDSDSLVRPETLRTVMPEFVHHEVGRQPGEPGLAFVQIALEVTNRNGAIPWTIGALVEVIERFVRPIQARYQFAHSFGHHVIFARDALRDVGGHPEDVGVAEDIDLSIALQLKTDKHGRRRWVTKRIDYLVLGEWAPETFERFKIQRSRWIYGNTRLFVKYAETIIRSDLPVHEKVFLFFYLSFYLQFLILILAGILMPAVLAASLHFVGESVAYPAQLAPFVIVSWLIPYALSYVVTLLHFARGSEPEGLRTITAFPLSLSTSFALIPTIVRETLRGLLFPSTVFWTTPKGAAETPTLSHILRTHPLELGLGLYFLAFRPLIPIEFGYSIPGLVLGVSLLGWPFHAWLASQAAAGTQALRRQWIRLRETLHRQHFVITWEREAPLSSRSRWFRGLAITIAAVALAVRFWDLGGIGPWMDESVNIVAGRHLFDPEMDFGWISGWKYAIPPVVAFGDWLFDSFVGARVIAAIFGSLTLLFAYGYSQSVLGEFFKGDRGTVNTRRSLAALAALGLAASPVFVSRLAAYDTLAYFFFAMGLYLFHRGARQLPSGAAVSTREATMLSAGAIAFAFAGMSKYVTLTLLPFTLGWTLLSVKSQRTWLRYFVAPFALTLGIFGFLTWPDLLDGILISAMGGFWSHGGLAEIAMKLWPVAPFAILALAGVSMVQKEHRTHAIWLVGGAALVFLPNLYGAHFQSVIKTMALAELILAPLIGVGLSKLLAFRVHGRQPLAWMTKMTLVSVLFLGGYWIPTRQYAYWWEDLYRVASVMEELTDGIDRPAIFTMRQHDLVMLEPQLEPWINRSMVTPDVPKRLQRFYASQFIMPMTEAIERVKNGTLDIVHLTPEYLYSWNPDDVPSTSILLQALREQDWVEVLDDTQPVTTMVKGVERVVRKPSYSKVFVRPGFIRPPALQVPIPTPLRRWTEQQETITLQGTTIASVLTDLQHRFPKLAANAVIWVNEEDSRFLSPKARQLEVSAQTQVIIGPKIAGGAPTDEEALKNLRKQEAKLVGQLEVVENAAELLEQQRDDPEAYVDGKEKLALVARRLQADLAKVRTQVADLQRTGEGGSTRSDGRKEERSMREPFPTAWDAFGSDQGKHTQKAGPLGPRHALEGISTAGPVAAARGRPGKSGNLPPPGPKGDSHLGDTHPTSDQAQQLTPPPAAGAAEEGAIRKKSVAVPDLVEGTGSSFGAGEAGMVKVGERPNAKSSGEVVSLSKWKAEHAITKPPSSISSSEPLYPGSAHEQSDEQFKRDWLRDSEFTLAQVVRQLRRIRVSPKLIEAIRHPIQEVFDQAKQTPTGPSEALFKRQRRKLATRVTPLLIQAVGQVDRSQVDVERVFSSVTDDLNDLGLPVLLPDEVLLEGAVESNSDVATEMLAQPRHPPHRVKRSRNLKSLKEVSPRTSTGEAGMVSFNNAALEAKEQVLYDSLPWRSDVAWAKRPKKGKTAPIHEMQWYRDGHPTEGFHQWQHPVNAADLVYRLALALGVFSEEQAMFLKVIVWFHDYHRGRPANTRPGVPETIDQLIADFEARAPLDGVQGRSVLRTVHQWDRRKLEMALAIIQRTEYPFEDPNHWNPRYAGSSPAEWYRQRVLAMSQAPQMFTQEDLKFVLLAAELVSEVDKWSSSATLEFPEYLNVLKGLVLERNTEARAAGQPEMTIETIYRQPFLEELWAERPQFIQDLAAEVGVEAPVLPDQHTVCTKLLPKEGARFYATLAGSQAIRAALLAKPEGVPITEQDLLAAEQAGIAAAAAVERSRETQEKLGDRKIGDRKIGDSH